MKDGKTEQGMAVETVQNYEPLCEQEEVDKRTMLEFIDRNPDFLERSNEIAHFSASAWITNKSRDKVLMIYHNIYQAWTWVGGHADGWGNLEAVARKETEEETGLVDIRLLKQNPVSIEILPVNPHYKKGKYVSSHLHPNVTYLYEAEETQMLRIKEDENSGVMWRTIEEIEADQTEPLMHDVYRKLIERMRRL